MSREDILIRRLERLYGEELQVYRQVRELSQLQGQLIKREAPMSEIRQVLQKKKNCLDVIARLEATERRTKEAWEKGKNSWSAQGRTRMQRILEQVGQAIEEILACEEENDRQLIVQASEF
jgi:hypothetical protein